LTAIPTDLPRRLTGGVLFISGFTTLSYEIGWLRGLHYFVGNATYTVSTVLVIFLVGLGLGSLLLNRVLRLGAPERALALCQIAIGVLAVAAMACDWLLLSQPAVRDNLTLFTSNVIWRPWWWRLLVGSAIAAVTMLPATLCMGLSFPLATRLFLGDTRRLDARVGAAYLLANLGSILGAILGAILLLPTFGTIGATEVGAALNLATGLVVLWTIRQRTARLVGASLAAIAMVGALAAILPASLPLQGEKLSADDAGEVAFIEEGDLATVQVLRDPDDPARIAMTLDGYKIGFSAGYRGTHVHHKQVLLAPLPMVLDTRIRHTPNVGLGSGATLDALASYPALESLDCVEINAAVVRGNRLFPESRVLQDPRTTLFVDDALHHLLTTPKRYDLIISDGKQHAFSRRC
jgi:spermidine synthase